LRKMARGKSIHVDAETHDRLKKRGVFGESFCDVIKRLLDQLEHFEVQPEDDSEAL
jgi:predicted CopG family antitoxin